MSFHYDRGLHTLKRPLLHWSPVKLLQPRLVSFSNLKFRHCLLRWQLTGRTCGTKFQQEDVVVVGPGVRIFFQLPISWAHCEGPNVLDLTLILRFKYGKKYICEFMWISKLEIFFMHNDFCSEWQWHVGAQPQGGPWCWKPLDRHSSKWCSVWP